VCIYDPYVFLYLEPTQHEALQFDVIFNVAREVQNPFEPMLGGDKTVIATAKESEASQLLEGATTAPKPAEPAPSDIQPSSSMASLRPALEEMTDGEGVSPTTPKAAQGGPASTFTGTRPEYVHMQWDHNTSIVDDLLRLVEQIDERVRQGKRILIHCQCGVSRSASLIVAYGLYKNPSLTVQEAYDAVKERSRWIGPNMSLIYQLSEFRTKLVNKNGAPQPGLRSWRNGGVMGNGRSNTLPTSSPTKRPSLSGEGFDVGLPRRSEPLTAPLPDERDRGAGPAGASTSGDDGRLNTESPSRLARLNAMDAIPRGPSSAPSGMTWLSDAMASGRPVTSNGGPKWGGCTTPSKDEQATSKLAPVKQTPSPSSPGLSTLFPTSSLAKKRSRNQLHLGTRIDPPSSLTLSLKKSMNSLKTDRSALSLTENVPDTPSLLSPRAIEFTANPFHPRSVSDSSHVTPSYHQPSPPKPTTFTHPFRPSPAPKSMKVGHHHSHTSSFTSPRSIPAIAPDVHAAAASSFGFAPSTFESIMSPTTVPSMTLPLPLPAPKPVPSPSYHATQTTKIQGGLVDDPRSPVQRGEAPIIRSIFDVL
jgi:tyrosine-protein phosphatase